MNVFTRILCLLMTLFLAVIATPVFGAMREQGAGQESSGARVEFRPLGLDLSDEALTLRDESDSSDSGDDRKKEDVSPRKIILVLNGTSSSGKSAHAKKLMAKLPKTWICQSIDDFDEKEIDDVGYSSKLMPENTVMIERIAELLAKGFNVLVDTVLDESKEFNNFHKTLQNLKVLKKKLQDFTILTVIVYCSPADLEKQVKARAADLDERTLSQSLDQFGSMYTASGVSSLPIVDRITREDIGALRMSPVLFKREPSGSDQVDRLITAVLNNLGFTKDVDALAITPRQSYDLVVNSRDGIESNVKKILALIEKKS